MSRHESEMHRERRQLLEVLGEISRRSSDPWARDVARLAIKAQSDHCNIGLFGDHAQLDLADRQDLKP